MTAEIAVMNKLAVALAADSAVTASFGKIYDSVDKLFALDHSAPVAFMVNGSAEFMGIPWETVVKLFRRDHAHPRSTLREYVEAFLKFLSSEELLSEAHIDADFDRTAQRILFELGAHLESRFPDPETRLPEIEAELKRLETAWSNRRFYAAMDGATAEQLLTRYGERTEEVVRHYLSFLNSSKALIQQASRLLCLFFTKENEDEGSGVVIAGFGESEIFPSVITHAVAGCIHPRLLRCSQIEIQSDQMGLDNDASIIPFAQAEMVHTFMNGVDPNYANTARSALKKLLGKFSNFIASNAPLKDESDRKAFHAQLKGFASGIVKEFHEEAQNYSVSNHQNPVIQAVAMLPKDMLAVMAESLVSLTSFRRRMSSDSETVGGAIDVAVVSKGDGLVWIKRKHYFDASMNPRYIERVRTYCSAQDS